MTTAYWCVLAAAILPYIFTAVAKAGAKGYNNAKPRDFQEKLEGWRRRAHWAHLNNFEAFPPFAAAVIIAHLANAPQERVDMLAIAFILFRVLHGVFYIANIHWMRSLVWFGAIGSVVGLFTASA
ncbi:MAPEG family protein [Sulfidibacter corallicola]|uniref:MAPEG family protein n=1 Tax=Sulfidibacter corallicola TaxID=2818388 RepID=A0A8A4TUM4_SULCO|nr:MAPEG family protein [Sulfidibacter corallicola]QTD52834.1 MAPEG family protein [Sulfidibacter corallicola]